MELGSAMDKQLGRKMAHHHRHLDRLHQRHATPNSFGVPKPRSLHDISKGFSFVPPDLSKRVPESSSDCNPDIDPACPQGSKGGSGSSSTSGSSSSSSSDSGKSCNSVVNPSCGKGAGQSNVTLPVVLGILIPLIAAILVFIWLHRRHVKKQRREDAMDPHKSLDFGLDPNMPQDRNKRKATKRRSETGDGDIIDEKNPRRLRGVSMDMDMSSPYVLPSGLHGSRESLHSMSRTIHSGDDRYRPATTFIPNDSISTRSFPTRSGVDDNSSSTDSGSSRKHVGHDSMHTTLLANAQRMSRSMPSISRTPPVDAATAGSAGKGLPASPASGKLAPAGRVDARDSYASNNGAALRKSDNYLGAFIHSREPSADLLASGSPCKTNTSKSPQRQGSQSDSSRPRATSQELSRPPRLQSLKATPHKSQELNLSNEKSEYGENFKITPPSPTTCYAPPPLPVKDKGIPVSDFDKHDANSHKDLYDPVSGIDFRRFSMGMRPLPPEDPSDNPEQRANRIRSFYKEYFDDSKPAPSHVANQYYEDYDEGYLDNGTVYNPHSGQLGTVQRPYAEPLGRRAMTPPPRAPPRFPGPNARPPRHYVTMSGGLTPPGPRAFSSASGRFGSPHRGLPKKALPPPGPLQILPSPHLLKEDSFALPIDFAPPKTYKDRAAGLPESPRGGQQPFSPVTPIAMPLTSSFDDLSVMPSPHALRKSGTFTALDFAPPPRFGHSATASDAGSIRSNHSAMSARQLHNIRAGAYRLSRIPKETVGTKSDINDALKPQWNMHNK